MTKGGDGNSAKCLAYLAAFIVFQTATLTLFALTVMRIESPKVRFDSVAVTEISSSNPNAPSFSMKLTTQFTIRNTNFGHFKYRNGTLTILYNGMAVGEAFIAEGRAKAKKKTKLQVVVDISSERLPGNTSIGSDINSGVLRLSSQAKLRGKVRVMKVIKKKKTGDMNCTMAVNLATRSVQDLKCK